MANDCLEPPLSAAAFTTSRHTKEDVRRDEFGETSSQRHLSAGCYLVGGVGIADMASVVAEVELTVLSGDTYEVACAA